MATVDRIVDAQAKLREVRIELIGLADECEGQEVTLQLAAAAGDLFTEAEEVVRAAEEIVNSIGRSSGSASDSRRSGNPRIAPATITPQGRG